MKYQVIITDLNGEVIAYTKQTLTLIEATNAMSEHNRIASKSFASVLASLPVGVI